MQSYDNMSIDRKLQCPRGIDFLPPVTYKEPLIPDVEVYYFRGHISEKAEGLPEYGEEVDTEFTTIRTDTTARRRATVESGAKDPFDRSNATFDTVTFRELVEDILANAQVPDIATTEIGVLYPAPDGLGKFPEVDGVEYVAHSQVAKGNRAEKFRQMASINVANPYEIIKGIAESNGLLEGDDGTFAKRVRATLATDHILTDTDATHIELEDADALLETLRALSYGNFWEDIGIPEELNLDGNGDEQRGRIYRLKTNEALVAL